ncbi:MAG: glycerophosphodiester phosphodiesterase [Ilumatobacteraceae bacterium]
MNAERGAGRHIALVAHRVGNDPAGAGSACPPADAVELDVHLFRRRLEVRHAKVLWPTGVRWDRWELMPRRAPRPTFGDVLAAVDPSVPLWIDLKGFDRRLTSKVLAAVGDRPATTVSSRSWWILPSPGQVPGVRVVHSIGSRLQLRMLRSRGSPVEGVAIAERLVTASVMGALRAVSPLVYVWGVHDAARGCELCALGVDGLIVDGADVLAELASRLKTSGSDETETGE